MTAASDSRVASSSSIGKVAFLPLSDLHTWGVGRLAGDDMIEGGYDGAAAGRRVRTGVATWHTDSWPVGIKNTTWGATPSSSFSMRWDCLRFSFTLTAKLASVLR